MRKLLVFLFTIATLPIALAQEVFIAGRSVSLVILLPIILIAIILLFFLFVLIKDHLVSIVKFIPKLPKRKIKKKEAIEFDYLTEIKKLESSFDKLGNIEALKNLSEIAKHFFRDKLKLDYEFTFDELRSILKKNKSNWLEFSDKLSNIKYSGKEISKHDILSLIKEFKKIASIKEHKIEKRPSFIDKLKAIITKKPKIIKKHEKEKRLRLGFLNKIKKEYISSKLNFFIKIKAEEKKILSNIKKHLAFIEENKLNAIDKLIMEGINLLDTDIKKAQENYAKALILYYQLDLKEEVAVGNRLSDFYSKIEEAINNKRLEYMDYIAKSIRRLKTDYVIPKKETAILTDISKVKDEFLALKAEGRIKAKKIRNLKLLLLSYAKRLSKIIKLREDKGYLSHAERKFIDELKGLLNYIKKKEEISLENIKLIETNLLNSIKKLALRKKEKLPVIKEEYPLAKEEVVKPSLEVKETFELPRIGITPKIKIKPFRLQKYKPQIPAGLKRSKEIKELVKEEKEIIDKLANVKKMRTSKHFVHHLTKRKDISKFDWQSYAEKIRLQKTQELRALINEENKLLQKINISK